MGAVLVVSGVEPGAVEEDMMLLEMGLGLGSAVVPVLGG
jgi:hypothetical protein